jgi:VWFA-related protein
MYKKLLRFGVFVALALAAQDSPTIRVNTRLVQISVIVHDKNGPVTGLTKDDFQVFDKGKEQKVAVFSVASTKAAPKGQPLPPGIFSNRVNPNGSEAANSVTVVLIDLLNTRFQDQAYARAQFIKFLKSLEPQDRVALYAMSGRGVRILHDFTQDQERLLRAISKLKGEVSNAISVADEPLSDTGNDDLDQALNDALGQMQDFYMVNRARDTLADLEAIGNHLGNIPGRKNLVWISGSFPFTLGIDDTLMDPRREHGSFSEEAQRASRALNKANVAIYPVDARGLIADPRGNFSAVSSARVNTKAPPKIASNIPEGHDTMQVLAERTGGRAFINTNDIRGAIRKAIDDSEVTYTLGFYPVSGDLDEKFHELKVKVDRKGVDVRHRKGYFAGEEKPLTDHDMDQIMSDAVASNLEATALGISGRVIPIDKPQPGSFHVAALLDISSVIFEHVQDRWSGLVQVAFVQVDAEGKLLAKTVDTVTLNFKEENYRKALKDGLILQRAVIPGPGLKSIRVVVQDRKNGTVGSLQLPLPKPAKA